MPRVLSTLIHREKLLVIMNPIMNFIEQDPQSPHVHLFVVRFLGQDLGRHVQRRPGHRAPRVVIEVGDAKVHQLERAIRMDHDIFGLDIAVNDGHRAMMEVRDGRQDLQENRAPLSLIKRALL